MSYLKRSPWVIHYDASSCNGCDLETLACLTPVYDIERLGVVNTGNPKHADIFLITGAVNEQNREVVRNIYEQMPDPKAVVAIGTCAASGGIFAECYNVNAGVERVVPVDVYVPGCAARPESIFDGIKKALSILDEKQRMLSRMDRGLEKITIRKADVDDAPEILQLQRLAFRSDAEIYNDFSIAPLTQTLEELKGDFKTRVFLKAVMNDQIIGSLRAFKEGGSCFIGRLVVNPLYQHHGVGKKLMREIEKYFGDAKRFEVHAGHKSKRSIYFYKNLGYRIFKQGRVYPDIDRLFVYMEKFMPIEGKNA